MPTDTSALPRLRFELAPDPEFTRTLGPRHEQLPLIILVVGDFTGRDDPRPLEDRRPIRVDRDKFTTVMASFKLVITVPGAPDLTLRIRSLTDFEPDVIAAQVTEQAPSTGDELASRVAAVCADARFRRLESAWRSLHALSRELGPHVELELLNCSKDDLAMDFDDSPEVYKSGLWSLTHHYNQLGMQPYSLILLDFELDPNERDARLLRGLLELLRTTTSPIFVGASRPWWVDREGEPLAPWRSSGPARHLALCVSRFVVRPAHASSGALSSGTAYLAALLVARSFTRYLCGSHFTGADGFVPFALAEPMTLHQAEALAERGYLAFASVEGGARLDRAAGAGLGPDARSLDASFVALRFFQQALNVLYRRWLVNEPDLAAITAGVNAGLAARLAPFPGVLVTVSDARPDPYEWRFLAVLHVTLPTGDASPPLTLRDELVFTRAR